MTDPLAIRSMCADAAPAPHSAPSTSHVGEARASSGMEVRVVEVGGPAFETVVALGRKHSRYLGMFPRGAFEEYALRRRILGAFTADGHLAGYLLYRVSQMYAVIVHLCVTDECRGQGVARCLFEALREQTRECQGARLRCRRDFPADRMWPRLGFKAVHEQPGRGQEGLTLTRWVYEYGQPTLFTALEAEFAAGRVSAVLDANVVYDLQDPASARTEESKALSADWLLDAYEYCVTKEIYAEIYRNESQTKREDRRSFVRKFREVSENHAEEQRLVEALRPLFPEVLSENDASDMRHLAKSIVGGASLFITRDEGLLGLANDVYDRFGLSIARPCEVIIGHDERLRRAEYHPARVAGSLSRVQRVSPPDLELLAETFLDYAGGEPKGRFHAGLHRYLADPSGCEAYVIRDEEGALAGVYIVDGSDPGTLRVPVLRVRRGRMAESLAAHVLGRAIQAAVDRAIPWVEVTDPHLPSAAEAGLRQLRFIPSGGSWIKLPVGRTLTSEGLREHVTQVAAAQVGHGAALRAVTGWLDALPPRPGPQHTSEVEQLFWPVKLSGGAIDNFIVPIQPDWAVHLFDEGLAEQTLFGARAELSLRTQNVYYRSAAPRVLTEPARILWYVSENRRYAGSKRIRAVSYVTEVLVGDARELYRRFRRMGVYEWRDLAKRYEGGRKPVMAFVFTHTELLRTPVAWREFQEILQRRDGARNPITSPVRISPEAFFDIYRAGTQATP